MSKTAVVIFLAHSNGPPTQYAFLKSMSADWKETYLAALISLSGNFLGQMNAFSTFISSGKTGEIQEMEATW